MAEAPTHATLFVSISTDAYEDCACIAECWQGKALASTPQAIRERIEAQDKAAQEIAAAIRAKGAEQVERSQTSRGVSQGVHKGLLVPRVIDARIVGEDDHWALTISWPNGAVTVEHVSEQAATLLGCPSDDPPVPGSDEEAAELFQSERISAALATFDYVLGDLEPDDPDREERTFDAMKAAIQRADHIARSGQIGER